MAVCTKPLLAVREQARTRPIGANRNDSIMLAPTLDAAGGRGLLAEIETLWLDRG